MIKSNIEAGEGFADIVAETDDPDSGIIVELKYTKEFERMEQACQKAIANGWNTKIDADGHIISDDKKVLADISQNDTEPQEAATETPVPEVLPPVEGESGKEKPQKQPKINFHYNLWETEKGGAKTRYQWNIDAIRTLKQIEAENRLATQEEQAVLSKFVGWGGLSQAFDENNAAWSKEYAELKELLSDEEYSAARATVNNAFYTSPDRLPCRRMPCWHSKLSPCPDRTCPCSA